MRICNSFLPSISPGRVTDPQRALPGDFRPIYLTIIITNVYVSSSTHIKVIYLPERKYVKSRIRAGFFTIVFCLNVLSLFVPQNVSYPLCLFHQRKSPISEWTSVSNALIILFIVNTLDPGLFHFNPKVLSDIVNSR